MNGQRKRKRQPGTHRHEADNTEPENRAYQTLPVADLPPGFDGIPLDGAQYLAVVRQESETVPDICYVTNPYAKLDSRPAKSNGSQRKAGSSSTDLMPSLEWREAFLKRFANMRGTLLNRPRQELRSSTPSIPRGRNGKKWYRFLHGRDLAHEVVYDDDEDDEESGGRGADVVEISNGSVPFSCREPTEVLLHLFSRSQIMSLLAVLPYWLTQEHVSPESSKGQAIDPFHSRWLFALLAHLEEQLVGDDISVLRILARACLACIVQSRFIKGAGGQVTNLQDEKGAWMIICAVAGIWGQRDLWEDGLHDLEQCAQALLSAS